LKSELVAANARASELRSVLDRVTSDGFSAVGDNRVGPEGKQ